MENNFQIPSEESKTQNIGEVPIPPQVLPFASLDDEPFKSLGNPTIGI